MVNIFNWIVSNFGNFINAKFIHPNILQACDYVCMDFIWLQKVNYSCYYKNYNSSVEINQINQIWHYIDFKEQTASNWVFKKELLWETKTINWDGCKHGKDSFITTSPPKIICQSESERNNIHKIQGFVSYPIIQILKDESVCWKWRCE